MMHKWLELIATSSVLTWITLHLVAPMDRKLLYWSKGRISITGTTTILLITTGAKSGLERHTSLPGLFDGENIVLLASKGGAKTHPAWYHNLVRHPDVQVINRGKRTHYIARIAEGDERDAMWRFLLDRWGGFAAYQQKAAPRVLPIVVLAPLTDQ